MNCATIAGMNPATMTGPQNTRCSRDLRRFGDSKLWQPSNICTVDAVSVSHDIEPHLQTESNPALMGRVSLRRGWLPGSMLLQIQTLIRCNECVCEWLWTPKWRQFDQCHWSSYDQVVLLVIHMHCLVQILENVWSMCTFNYLSPALLRCNHSFEENFS